MVSIARYPTLVGIPVSPLAAGRSPRCAPGATGLYPRSGGRMRKNHTVTEGVMHPVRILT